MDDEIHAVVNKIISRGRHGPYAVASADIGTITFSLTPPVWTEAGWPETGTFVLLKDVRKKRAGWRAMNGRFVRPSDEQ